jgi:putative ABC transport system permease protein
MDILRHDLRHALRALVKNPGLTAAGVLTLSLGIGASTSMFTLLNAVLIRPLPYPESERIVKLYTTEENGDQRDNWSGANFMDFRSQATSYESLAGVVGVSYSVHEGGFPARVRGASVTPAFFEVFGLPPQAGRALDPAIDTPDGERAVVLGHAFWSSRFAADPAVVGKSLELNGDAYTVVGVMPPGFDYPDGTQLWVASRYRCPDPPVPLGDDPVALRGAGYFNVIARICPGVSLAQAAREGDAISARLAADYPETNAGEGLHLEPLYETVVRDVRPVLMVLCGAVGLLLLVACANVANLLLARAAARTHEMALRTALGAGGRHIAGLLLTESLVLSLAGGIGGILVAFAVIDALVPLIASDLPRAAEVTMDPSVLVFALVASVVAALLAGVTPCLWLSRGNPATALRSAGDRAVSGAVHGRTRAVLIVAELAVSLSLLVGAGLLGRTLVMLNAVDPGFTARNAVTARINVPGTRFLDEGALRTFQRSVLERVRSLPGVASAGTVLSLPIDPGITGNLSFALEGRTFEPGNEPTAGYQLASEDYFRTIGIPVLRGRTFSAADGPNSEPVALISKAFAERYFPDQDPLGQRITWSDPEDPDTVWSTIVGVVGNTRLEGLDSMPRIEAYQPMAQAPLPFMTLVLQATVPADTLVEPLRQAVMELSPSQPVEQIMTMDEILHDSLATRRISMILLWVFAGIAVTLAAVGLFGVISFSVSQRAREVGIRMAMGASSGRIRGLVLREAGRLLAVGLVFGAMASAVLARLLSSLLFQVRPMDPVSFATAAAIVALATLVAAWVPAWRAARRNPMAVLGSN